MAMNRSVSQKDNLLEDHGISVDEIVKDDYTHYIQISAVANGEIIDTIPFDPTDRSVTGVLSGIKNLENQEEVLKALSDILINKVGSKKLLVIPEDSSVANFDSPEKDNRSERMHYADCEQLLNDTNKILQQYPELTNELNKKLSLVASEEAILGDKETKSRYQEVNNILEKANFTKGKQIEYKEEELQGKVCRFRNEFIRPMAVLDKKATISGLLRAVLMGNNFAYLSDEVMNQDILPLHKFSGQTEEAKKVNREIFLLAFLLNNACKIGLADQKHLFIMAAAGREYMYEAIGFKKCPVNIPGWKVVSNFNAPGPVIQQATERVKKLPLPVNPKAKTENKNDALTYATYAAGGLVLFGAGFVAYNLLKDKISLPEVFKIKGPGMN